MLTKYLLQTLLVAATPLEAELATKTLPQYLSMPSTWVLAMPLVSAVAKFIPPGIWQIKNMNT